ncbi:hypothetical protein CCUG60885_04249 [Mycobacteroides salmoniphilum]|uniref:Uncharacterized protein n=1 Tax=Mycobacteroides salmoniphilum TaxID=404941 RepID=A0A4R8SBZ7_9MYCO|nr:hypothetical protein CCUG60885_04249 [Mycobacteroides salmoniphilum]TEA07364.1 hypothetical protein CCUG60883_01397 [Mycobacteroides salmoniphilum]
MLDGQPLGEYPELESFEGGAAPQFRMHLLPSEIYPQIVPPRLPSFWD